MAEVARGGYGPAEGAVLCVAATKRACRTCDMLKTTAHVQLVDSVDPELRVWLHYMKWYKSRTGRTQIVGPKKGLFQWTVRHRW